MTNIACDHAPVAGALCAHLDEADEYCEVFTGRGLEHDRVCPACAEVGLGGTIPACAACAARAIASLAWNTERGVVGRPEILARDAGLAFVHERVEPAARLPAPIVELQPAPGAAPIVFAVLADGALWRVDLAQRSVEPVAPWPGKKPPAGAVALAIAPGGRFAAVADEAGGGGAVIELGRGEVVLALERGDHRAGDPVPLALVERGGKTLLVHATRWNRLDVLDVASGELLTSRSHGAVAEGERLPHYLDLRHAALAVSPGGVRVAAVGESEAGLTRAATFDLGRMLEVDPWESEDGASRREHAARWYAPDPAVAWVDDRVLAVWGHGPSSHCLIDAVTLCDADSGAELGWFPGPRRGGLVAAGGRILSWDEAGTEVWDPATGERLLDDRGLVPQRYHAGAGAFVSTNPAGELFVLSRLVARGAAPV